MHAQPQPGAVWMRDLKLRERALGLLAFAYAFAGRSFCLLKRREASESIFWGFASAQADQAQGFKLGESVCGAKP